MNPKARTKIAPEVSAIGKVHAALESLDVDAQRRVLSYVAQMLKITATNQQMEREEEPTHDTLMEVAPTSELPELEEAEPGHDEIEGISGVAKKWMLRNGLSENQLSAVFSLGVDEIDVIAKSVPGKSQRDRVRSVALLKGIASYLGTGAARFTHQQLKETCLHYDAYDATNFSRYLKSLASEVSGNRASGYALTARGIASSTELIKTMTQQKKGA